MIKKISTEKMDVQTRNLTERTARSCHSLCLRNCPATYNDEVSASADIHMMA